MPKKTKLYKYQKIGINKIIKFGGRALLADEMGLGKTIQALTYLKLKPKQRPTLIVCPASAKYVWKAEIKKHTSFSGRILNGRTTRKLSTYRDVTIINYDVLHYWKDELGKYNFNLLILDECQYMKSWRAKRTKAVIYLGKRIPHIISMSGTPLTNRPKELYTTLHLLLPNTFKSYIPYAFRYCGRRMTPWGWDDTGATHLDELHQKLKETCMIRRTKKEVLTELPNKNRIIIPLEIQNKAKYVKAEKDFISWYTQKIINDQTIDQKEKRTKIKKAQQAEALIKLGEIKRLASELKMKYVFDWINTMLEDTDEKVIVFAYHKKIIRMLKERYNKICVVVDGSVVGRKRQQAVDRFQTNKKTRLFIGQIVAAGTAITLTATSTVVFVELDWVPGNLIQCEDRAHRIGQTNKVFVYYLVAKNTIEEKLCRVLQLKFKVIMSVLDGTKSKKNDFNIFDRLMNWYERRL